MDSKIAILYNSSCKSLAGKVMNILTHLGIPVVNNKDIISIGSFRNGELTASIQQNIRGKKVYIIAGFGAPFQEDQLAYSVNDLLMQTLLICDAAKNAGAKKTILINTCFGYARQDRVDFDRKPLSSRVTAQLLENPSLGIRNIWTIDIHCQQLQNAFSRVHFENIKVAPLFAKRVAEFLNGNYSPSAKICVVSPDKGAVQRNNEFKNQLHHYINLGISDSAFERNIDFAIINKERENVEKQSGSTVTNDIENMDFYSNCSVKDKICIIYDDICDSGGTLCKAGKMLKDKGALLVIGCITHPVFSGNASEKIEESAFNVVFVTDSLGVEHGCSKIEMVSLDALISTAIYTWEKGGSMKSLYKLTDKNHVFYKSQEIPFEN